ncbi:STAS domain-containing protein [Cellulomonas sp. JH27-2]|uniref:STAS domain-containing protein n=1 Tax=Cellulomonas sp. JH27-2 TaxID=2774139 RepID=UPI001782A3FD|nr:STAS domain-containing protein [Cellulomonas sp. JH27-2]MBD8058998.1 STAS domain-containing protein [Cellulomonas sp. JH27-2]
MSTELTPDDDRTSDDGTASTVRVVVAHEPGGTVVLRLVGEADALVADDMRRELCAALRARPSPVALDLSELAFCDLAGLLAIGTCVTQAHELGCAVELRNATDVLTWLDETTRDSHGSWLRGLAVSSLLTDHET